MKPEVDRSKLLKSAATFGIVLLITCYIAARKCNAAGLRAELQNIKIEYLVLGALCMVVFVSGEALNIGRLLRATGYHTNVGAAYKYAATGFFFSGITPSSSGGQPLQLYFMNQDKVHLSHGSVTLLIETASFQVVGITVAIIGAVVNQSYFMGISGTLRIAIIIGLLANALCLALILTLLFWSKASKRLAGWCIGFCKHLGFWKRRDVENEAELQLAEYRTAAEFIRLNTGMLIKTVATSVIQLCAGYSVTWFVYLSMGLHGASWLTLLSLQALLSVSVAVIPIPGSVGVSESGFVLLFGSLFGGGVMLAMLLSRAVNFYLTLIATGLVVLLGYCKKFVAGRTREKAP